jgi:hypothetical protein
VILIAVPVLVAATYRATARTDSGIIRVRGIVVEDAAGRPRILIGAPIPDAANRVRTDTARVRQIWAPRFPGRPYMDYYRNYKNSMIGMLIMNDSGFDRVLVGDSTPDPNIGRRIGPATGVVINDAHGFEHGGFSILTVDGHDRTVLGLDSRAGEAAVLSAYDSGTVGLRLHSLGREIFIGRAPPDDSGGLNGEAFFGAVAYRGDRVTYRVSAAGPSVH